MMGPLDVVLGSNSPSCDCWHSKSEDHVSLLFASLRFTEQPTTEGQEKLAACSLPSLRGCQDNLVAAVLESRAVTSYRSSG